MPSSRAPRRRCRRCSSDRPRIPYVADWADLWGPGRDGRDLAVPRAKDARHLRRLAAGADGRAADRDRDQLEPRRARRRARRSRPTASGLVPVGSNDDVFHPGDPLAARRGSGSRVDAPVVVHTGFAPFDDGLLAGSWAAIADAEPRRSCSRPAGGSTARPGGEPTGRRGVRQLGTLRYADLDDVMAAGDVMVFRTRATPTTRRVPEPDRRLRRGRAPCRDEPDGRPRGSGRAGANRRLAPPTPEAMAAAVVELLRDVDERAAMGAGPRVRGRSGSWSERPRARARRALRGARRPFEVELVVGEAPVGASCARRHRRPRSRRLASGRRGRREVPPTSTRRRSSGERGRASPSRAGRPTRAPRRPAAPAATATTARAPAHVRPKETFQR